MAIHPVFINLYQVVRYDYHNLVMQLYCFEKMIKRL